VLLPIEQPLSSSEGGGLPLSPAAPVTAVVSVDVSGAVDTVDPVTLAVSVEVVVWETVPVPVVVSVAVCEPVLVLVLVLEPGKHIRQVWLMSGGLLEASRSHEAKSTPKHVEL